MYEELLAQQNLHWTGEHYDSWVERSCFETLVSYLESGQVVAITGVRRSGKSTLVRQLIDFLVREQGVPADNILFANLEHPYLSPYREEVAGLQRLYEEYLTMRQPEGLIYLFLDEVQFFRDWPIFVKAHHETGKVRFVVTGSNAAMLSSDMVTLLSGRSLPLEVFPFSLRELARNRGIDIENTAVVARVVPALRHLFEQLLEYGGFPTVAADGPSPLAYEILGAHARTVLLQDVAPRLGVRKPADLEQLYVYLVSNIGKLFSYAGLSKLFDLSDKSIKEYLGAFGDAYLLYELDLFAYSLKKQVRSPKKIYAIDTGQANAMGFKFSANRGRLLENLIFVDLKRLGFDVYYYHTRSGREVDFVVKRGTDLSLVQVTWDINDPEARERELTALHEAMTELNCSNAILIVAERPLSNVIVDPSITLLAAHHFLIQTPAERKRLLF